MSERSEQPLRILVWKTEWLPVSETFVRNQIAGLRTNGAHVTSVGLRQVESPISDPDDIILFSNTQFGRSGRWLAKRGFVEKRTRRAILDAAPDVILAHFATDAFGVLRAARRLGIPVATVMHGSDVMRRRSSGERRRLSKVLRQSDSLVTVSAFLKSQLVARGIPASRITVLPIGIPTETREVEPMDSTDLVFVGRLSAVKGAEDVLQALSLLNERGIAPSVRIVGDGHLRSQLEETASELTSPVEFTGALNPEQVHRALQSSAVFVGPSKTAPNGDQEGFGIVFLEAALAGLPVVAYRHGGVQEAVEDSVTGILVEEGDVTALSRSIGELLVNPDLRSRLGDAARTRVLVDFDVNRRSASLLSHLVTLARTTPRFRSELDA